MPTGTLSRWRCCVRVICFVILLSAAHDYRADAQSPTETPAYQRLNSFGIIAAYSPDSSHILLGISEKRKLWNLGLSYSRRLINGGRVVWAYDGEFLPVALDGDPLGRSVLHETSPKTTTLTFDDGPVVSCAPRSGPYTYTDFGGVVHKGVVDAFCHGRRWTFGQAISPLGLQWNFRPRHMIQPLLTAHVGYMYSNKPIPTFGAGAFNFTFDVGAGFELFQARTRSVRVQYRYHHISNHNSAYENPGIDNGLIQVSYVFGR